MTRRLIEFAKRKTQGRGARDVVVKTNEGRKLIVGQHQEIQIFKVNSLFGWLVLVVNDRKFPTGTVFFSHTKSASSTSRISNEQAQPNEQAEN